MQDGTIPAANLDVKYAVGLSVNVIREAANYSQARAVIAFPGIRGHHRVCFPKVIKITESPVESVNLNETLLHSAIKRSKPLIANATAVLSVPLKGNA